MSALSVADPRRIVYRHVSRLAIRALYRHLNHPVDFAGDRPGLADLKLLAAEVALEPSPCATGVSSADDPRGIAPAMRAVGRCYFLQLHDTCALA